VKPAIGTTDVPSAGTAVRLSADSQLNATDRILWARFSPREGNSGEVYVGVTGVSATDGFELDPGGANKQKDTLILNFRELGGSFPAGDIYFDADANGNDIDWVLIIED